MKEWKEYKMGDVFAYLKSGKGIHANEISPKGKYPVFGGNGLRGYTTRNNFEGDCAIIGRQGAFCGNVRYFKGKAYMTEHAIIAVANENNSTRFLAYLLSIMNLGRFSSQSAQPGLSVTELAKQSIRIPSLSVQKKIANILSSLDSKIELNRRINDNLEQQAQALFKSWFVYFEPFKDGEFVDSELGMIPKGWRVESLSSLGSIICGKTPPKSNPEYYNGSIPFVKIPDMHNNIFITKSEDNLSEKGMRYQANKTIPPYSILVSCIATVGLVSMNTKTCQTNQQINAYIPDKDFYRFYLFILLKSMKEYLITLGSGGTATLNVNTSQFSNIKVVVPNAEILVKFSGLVSPIFQNIKLACDENFALSQLRDTFLPRLMSGELRINELNC